MNTPRLAGTSFALNLRHKYLHLYRTKIIATIGPATSSPAMIRRLLACGVSVIGIDFSHGKVENLDHNMSPGFVGAFCFHVTLSMGHWWDTRPQKTTTRDNTWRQ